MENEIIRDHVIKAAVSVVQMKKDETVKEIKSLYTAIEEEKELVREKSIKECIEKLEREKVDGIAPGNDAFNSSMSVAVNVLKTMLK